MVTTPSNAAEAITLAATGNRALAAAGQSDMVWGHASVRDPEGRGVWMKCSGWGFEEVDEQKIVLVTPEGKVLHGSGRRHIEYPIHTEIMARRGDVGAVVHSHSDAANAFSALDVPIRPLNHAGSLFSYPDVPRFTLTGGLISTRELGQALADALGAAPACLMPQHGIVAVRKDLVCAVAHEGEKTTLDFYALPENLEKAKVQFAQADGMLEAFEHYFGRGLQRVPDSQ